MRSLFLVFALTALSFLSFPETAYSQSVDTVFPEDKQPPPAAPVEKVDKDPYAIATDDQIEEAQRFYESCKSNYTMNTQKDCKCAAASYLETRMDLGKEASVEEIMQENINSCLLDDKKGTISNIEKLGLEDVTEQQMEEAMEVYGWCDGLNRLRNQTDCECLAAKFLDFRIKRGPMASQEELVTEISQKYCRNVVETTGLEYSTCMKGAGFSYRNIRPKDYCECYAKMWGKMFKEFEGRMDAYKKSAFRLRARGICSKPDYYKDKK